MSAALSVTRIADAWQRGAVIRLPNGRLCSIPSYVAAWRALKVMRPDSLVASFDHFPEPASRVLAALRDGLVDRINKHDPRFGRGRKWSAEWQRGARDVAWRLNGQRIVTRERDCPHELRARLAHRLYRNDE